MVFVIIVEECIIGVFLGEENIVNGFVVLVFGMVMMLIFMVFWYCCLGWVVNVVLLVNMVCLLGLIVLLLGVVLILLGIVGLVLIVGMVVDINVLIFECICDKFSEGCNFV